MNIQPYEKNAKKHPDKQLKQIAKSLKEFGWQQPIVVDKNGVIIAGHGRWKAYEKYPDGVDTPWIKDNEGNTIQGKAGKKLNTEQIRAYRLADNKLNESEWDMELAIEELKELEAYDNLLDLISFENISNDEILNTYTKKIIPPVYKPKKEKPPISLLYDSDKAEKLFSKIESLEITDNEKKFLKFAAYRLVIFNFQNIADYYANSGDELKKIMEDLALVIPDFNGAIENGYIDLCEKILNLEQNNEE